MINLVKLPIVTYSSDGPPMKILELEHFQAAFVVLSGSAQKIISGFFVDKIIENDGSIDIEHIDAALGLVRYVY